MGGRSANRGSCAQQCRLPYELVCDGQVRDLQDRKYLLSPSDLSALDLVPQLIAAGVRCFKIEGRMKPPEYVASVTRQYRHAIDEGMAGRPVQPPPEQLLELESPFSRGLSHGWLAGRNLQIVDGRNSANRGILLGKVAAVRGRARRRRACRPGAPRRRRRLSFRSSAKLTTRAAASTKSSRETNRSRKLTAARSNWRSAAMRWNWTACGRVRKSGRPTIRKSTAACGRRLPMARRNAACRWI